ncbi:glycolipid 2-alpha-mannosyltransferase-domain-containing protein [Endogone sp. FLAS-F59071]|nr:glycolipid 2-alpha-mannosyltransferase-domain-containing protein [Endogone sp. FLAS-F59071]|eukprot:RUS13134.1 glycolipid 2-alpha-mannosyltransferase-domain-containing protein [Endogone sp. FLAS-F59071]
MPRIRLTYVLLLVSLLIYCTSFFLNPKSPKSFDVVRRKPNRKSDTVPHQPQEKPKDLQESDNMRQKKKKKEFGPPDDTVERLRVVAENLAGEHDDGGSKSDHEANKDQTFDPIAEILANLQPTTTSTIVATPTPKVYTEADWRSHYSPLLTNPSPYGKDFLPERTLANAAIVILCRNSELQPLRHTIREFEDRFNRKFGYPYVLLNDVPFTQEFKETISNLTRANTTFGLIPEEMWSWPPWIEQETALRYMQRLEAQRVMYGGSLSYRHMCRFNSGFFYRHPLLKG